MPALGNNYFSSGAGHVIFNGYGDVEITGGLGNNNIANQHAQLTSAHVLYVFLMTNVMMKLQSKFQMKLMLLFMEKMVKI